MIRAHLVYQGGGVSKMKFYDLVKQGRIRLYHVGKASYVAEDWPEIVERIDREDREQVQVVAGRKNAKSTAVRV